VEIILPLMEKKKNKERSRGKVERDK